MELELRISYVEAYMKTQVAHVKTGLQDYDTAVERIHQEYMDLFDKIRYPSEPSITIKSLSQEEIMMQQQFNQSDKGK